MEVLGAMLERISHPQWGRPRRRVFQDVSWDAKLEQDLQGAVDSGGILEFRREGRDLVVLRPWVDGMDVRSFFGDATFTERRDCSRDLYAAAISQLDERPHGAVHPDNMLQVQGGLVLFDWVANAARLRATPEFTATYDIWLWHSHVPPGWKTGDWDRVNLFRMAALLQKGPSWDEPLPFPAMVQHCRTWAEAYIRDLTAGDVLQSELRFALRLLDIIQPPEPTPSPRPTPPPPSAESEKLAELEEHLETLFRQSGHRMLRPEDEKIIDQKFGADAPVLLAVALGLLDAERQEDVKKTAKAFLDAGIYEKSRVVRSSACRNAERLFIGLGVPREEAERLVRQLLATDGLKDSRSVQNDWAREVEKFLSDCCGRQRQYTQRQFSKMVKLVAGFGLPDSWAKVQLRHYLDESRASMRRSFFGF